MGTIRREPDPATLNQRLDSARSPNKINDWCEVGTMWTPDRTSQTRRSAVRSCSVQPRPRSSLWARYHDAHFLTILSSPAASGNARQLPLGFATTDVLVKESVLRQRSLSTTSWNAPDSGSNPSPRPFDRATCSFVARAAGQALVVHGSCRVIQVGIWRRGSDRVVRRRLSERDMVTREGKAGGGAWN